jgi:hypothetical protein
MVQCKTRPPTQYSDMEKPWNRRGHKEWHVALLAPRRMMGQGAVDGAKIQRERERTIRVVCKAFATPLGGLDFRWGSQLP